MRRFAALLDRVAAAGAMLDAIPRLAPRPTAATERTYERLKDGFVLEPRGVVEVKGKGPLPTYVLVAEREPLALDAAAD